MTFQEFIEQTYIPYKKRRVKPSTIAAYLGVLKNKLIPYFGDYTYDQITRRVVEDFALEQIECGVSKKTASDYVVIVKNVLKIWAEEYELPLKAIRVNWPTDATLSTQKELVAYTQEELKKIVDYVATNPLPQNVAVVITIATGMRIGEICALRYEDIDLTEKKVYVKRTIERLYDPTNEVNVKDGLIKGANKTKLVISTPKTITSSRAIPLVPQLVNILKHLKSVYPGNFYVASNRQDPTEPRTLRNSYKKLILEKVKLNRCIKFHGLRHSFATILIANGVDVKTASVLLGHSNIDTTMNIYVHPTEDKKGKAIKSTFGKMFGSKKMLTQ